jgi:hypothetical protein
VQAHFRWSLASAAARPISTNRVAQAPSPVSAECYNQPDLTLPSLTRAALSFDVGTWLSLVEHSLGVRGVGSSNLPVPTILLFATAPSSSWLHREDPSASLRISAAGSRSCRLHGIAHARKTPQVQICPSRPFFFLLPLHLVLGCIEEILRLRSGFRLRAPAHAAFAASLTPAKRLSYMSASLWIASIFCFASFTSGLLGKNVTKS